MIRRTKPIRRSKVRAKRTRPRRGHVVDRAYVEWMHRGSCLLAEKGFGAECRGLLTFHHVRETGAHKNDRRGLRLCEAHHLAGFGPGAIHTLGKARWQERYGVSIEEEIERYNRAYEEGHRDAH